MGRLIVLNQSGDETIEWDPADKESVAKAKASYDRLKKEGFEFFEVTDAKGKRIERWNAKLGKVIAAPGVQSQDDKTAGARPKAMAGGPRSQLVSL